MNTVEVIDNVFASSIAAIFRRRAEERAHVTVLSQSQGAKITISSFSIDERFIELQYQLFDISVGSLLIDYEATDLRTFCRTKDQQIGLTLSLERHGTVFYLLLHIFNILLRDDLRAKVFTCDNIRRIGKTKGAVGWKIIIDISDN